MSEATGLSILVPFDGRCAFGGRTVNRFFARDLLEKLPKTITLERVVKRRVGAQVKEIQGGAGRLQKGVGR